MAETLTLPSTQLMLLADNFAKETP
jgi:hypothetical protein